MYINIEINNFNIHNYLSGKRNIKYDDINKYDGATYDLDYNTVFTNYKKDNKLIIKNINFVSIYIPYKKLILHSKFYDKKIIEKIFINLQSICKSNIICSFNIGFWKSIMNGEIIKDVILKLTQKIIYINKLIIKKYIEMARELKYLFEEEIITIEINDSLFLI